jgi:hypothetical protein
MFKINIPAIIPLTLASLFMFVVIFLLRRGDDNVSITYSNSSKEEFKAELLSHKKISSEVSPEDQGSS